MFFLLCVQNSFAQDCGLPTLNCQDITVSINENGIATVQAIDFNSGSAVPCGLVSATVYPSSFSCQDVGENEVLITVLDQAGNIATCSTSILVEDNDFPVLTNCPENISAVALPNICGAFVNWSPPSFPVENCVIVNVVASHIPNDFFPVGTTMVSYVANDLSGNTVSCFFEVTVTDNESPTFSNCTDDVFIFVTEENVCEQVASWLPPTANDNCAVANIESSHQIGDVFSLGTTTVVYTATDESGNAANCQFDVILIDNAKPTFSNYPNDINVSTTQNACSAIATWNEPVANDCSDFEITSNFASSDSFPLGTTTVIYTATDFSGNENTCQFDVIVTDNNAPIFNNCPNNITINTLQNACSAVATWNEPTATDCSDFEITSNFNAGDNFPLGTTTVVYTAIDLEGNENICSFEVAVIDNESPEIANCPSDIEINAESGLCGAVVHWEMPNVADNCEIFMFFSDDVSGDFFDVGTTTISYTATDLAGNSANCSFNITVLDNEMPILNVPNEINTCESVVFFDENMGFDYCSNTTLIFTPPSGTSFPLGTSIVEVQAMDEAGNSSFDSFIVNYGVMNEDLSITTSDYNGFNNRCFDSGDAWAKVAVMDESIYSFEWSDGQTTATAHNLDAGVYSVTVNSGMSCSQVLQVVINQPTSLFCSAFAEDALCYNEPSGAVNATIAGGTPPYDYHWQTPDGINNDINIENARVGSYVLTVTDANDCACSKTVQVNEPLPFQLISGAEVNNNLVTVGSNNYYIHNFELSGGTAPYYYNWSSSGYLRKAVLDIGEIAVIYQSNTQWSVTITDANGCGNTGEGFIISNVAEIDIFSPLVVDSYEITPTHATANTGSIDISVQGGDGNYTYEWYGASGLISTSEDVNELEMGWYTVFVSDGSGHTTTGWYWVSPTRRGRGKIPSDSNANVALNVFPNPCVSESYVEFWSRHAGMTEVSLYGTDYKKIAILFQEEIDTETIYNIPINIDKLNLTEGVYIVHIKTSAGQGHKKLVVLK
ncbi:MAG: HYR domain-containing protein [Chitinophagales bacterium]